MDPERIDSCGFEMSVDFRTDGSSHGDGTVDVDEEFVGGGGPGEVEGGGEPAPVVEMAGAAFEEEAGPCFWFVCIRARLGVEEGEVR